MVHTHDMRKLRNFRWLLFVLSIGIASAAYAQEQKKSPIEYINTSFENASQLDWEIDSSGTVVISLIYDHERSSINRANGHWFFQVQAPAGSDVTLELKNFVNFWNGMKAYPVTKITTCLVSKDGRKWWRIPTELTPDYRLRMKLHMDADRLYLASVEPYRISDLENLKKEIKSNPLVNISNIGHTVEGRPLEIIRVGNPEAPHRIFLRARAHSWEPGGNWVVDGLIHSLLQKDAAKYLKRYCVYIMPMANKDGVAHGRTRFNAMGTDLNRKWDQPADSVLSPEKYAMESFIINMIRKGKKPDLVMDLHNDNGGNLHINEPNGSNQRYVANLNRFLNLLYKHTWFTEGPAHLHNPGSLGEGLAKRFNVDACIFEFNYEWIEGLKKAPDGADWQLMGKQLRDVFYYYFEKSTQQADVIIYGGTSAGIAAAVEARKMGKSVIVISPEKHLGGMSSNGLGFTDTGNKEVIGGLSRDFYHRVYMKYQKDSAWKWQRKDEYGNKGQGTPAMDGGERTMWIFEPHIAEQVFEDFVKENNIKVYRNEWLNRDNGVVKNNNKIESITTINGITFKGKVFIDATYEGDLMAAAGVSYTVGREANSVYGEKWNGIQTGVFQHGHHFKTNISPYKVPGDSSSGLLPRISSKEPGIKGEGDKRLQAYCFRMCLSNHPQNRVPFKRPIGYDSTQYELLARVFQSGWDELFQKFDAIPNRKTDTNNHGPFSTDNIGMNYDYPEASYGRREEIMREHELYQRGLMYFMSVDPRVPKKMQDELNTWGLAKDEFTDNDNWPHEMYVREARRMVSDYVMTEHETLSEREVPQPIGMGSYTLDSHNAQRYVTPEGFVQNEGDIGVEAKQPYHISYKALVPKQSECANLVVPVCISSSHIAYGSIRMEPVFMILGQSAAAGACLSIDQQTSVQDIDYNQLKKILESQGQRL